MRKLLIILLSAIILLNAFGNAAAQEELPVDEQTQEELPVDEQPQEDECDDQGIDCITCRDNSFYYVLIVGLIIFAVFFYLRNKEHIK